MQFVNHYERLGCANCPSDFKRKALLVPSENWIQIFRICYPTFSYKRYSYEKNHFFSFQSKADVLLLVPDIPSRLKNLGEVAGIVKKSASARFDEDAKVETFDLSVGGLETLLSKVMAAKMLVGMTSSNMIAALFLPKTSAVVELFPFGLGPDVSSFIQVIVFL